MKNQKPFGLYGIFGYPLGHTLSPAMHEAGFREIGIDANYLVLELDPPHFQKIMRKLSQCVLSGFNVTVPYKEAVLKYLGKISPEAKAIGAVNTVYKKGRVWTGVNTDMQGFLISLKEEGRFRPKGRKAVVLGGGGASRAVTYGLAKSGVKKITVADVITSKAKDVVRKLKRQFPAAVSEAVNVRGPELRERILEADLIINATPLGLKKQDPLAIPPNWIPEARGGAKLFMDLIYNPAETRFLKAAKKNGHRTLSGLGMLLYQGARAFDYWTGKKAPLAVMRKALFDALGSGGRS